MERKVCDNCRVMREGPFVERTCEKCYTNGMLSYADEAEWALTKLAPPETMGEDEDACTVYEFIKEVRNHFKRP